jgi:circadian clock protein KaiC
VQAAAERGEGAVIFCFDERKDTFIRRSVSLNMEIPAYIDQGLVELRQVDAGQISPGEFSHLVVKAVENTNARVVVIDSLTGFLNSMPGEINLLRQLHELLSYLGALGILTIIVMNKFDSTGLHETEIDVSYIADTLIIMRHFEAMGTLRRSVAVVKKRHGPHAHTIHEIQITNKGLELGPPLTEFTGVLSGNLRYFGSEKKLLNHSDAD